MHGKRKPLGDSHNFGRRVAFAGDRVVKPRTVAWEQLLLSARSPLRRLLAEAAAPAGDGRPDFGFLPDLKFFRSRARHGGEVARVELRPLRARSRQGRHALARTVGSSLALWSWLGVADLHWENLVLGVADDERVVFAPLDIEMILADLSLPTETKLLPDADPEYAAISRHACGARRVLPYLGKPIAVADLVAMAGAYHTMLAFLDRLAPRIADVLARLPQLRETPIRVCLRGTDEYVHARSVPPWPPLLDAEVEQLDRGDIPYFFRLYGRPGIHYWGDRALTERRTLALRGDVPRLEPLLAVSRALRSPTRTTLREQGLFTLLAAFDDESLTGRHRTDELDVTFGARSLVVRLPDGEQLRSRRDLSAFVGSVYLPCRCGEVRSVFVPPVTVCVAERRPASGVQPQKRRGTPKARGRSLL